MPSALDGITVLDLTQGRTGAMCAMFLCDNGARVIHVELPEREDSRHEPGYMIWDRGKESVSLDIAEDTEAFHKLVRMADVLVEDFAPSSEYQKTVAYDALRPVNPRLVHCSITAFGKDGPLRDEYPRDDLVMARMGILSSQPGFRPGPVHVAHPVPSVGGAVLAAQGIVASLLAREKMGAGRKVEASLMAGALLYAPKVVDERLTPRPFQSVPQGGGPFYSVFQCADGEWIQLGCIHGGFVDLAAAVMGIADVMTDPRYGDGRMPSDEAARRELFEIVKGVIATRPYSVWAEIFEAADVPFARACNTEESFENPQVIANEIVVELDDPRAGHVTQMGLPLKFTKTPGRIKGPRPLSGQHTDAVLAEIAGVAPSKNEASSSPMLYDTPLKGIKVLEMTNVIAGPSAGKCLADLGADVIKLESLDGDISRPSGLTYFLHLNANKRSVSINTRTAEGREVAQRLASQADIMLANMRPGATDRMGLSTDVMNKLNPGLISAHVTAFGWTGPFAHRPGVDPLAQAWMGLQRAQGGRDNPPVFLSQLAPTDYTAGAMMALGAIMALYVRERTGVTQKVDSNLLNAGALLSLDAFTRYEGKPPRRLADKGQYGLSTLHRLYETKEGWLYLLAEDQPEWERLCRAIGRSNLLDDNRFASQAARLENDAALAAEVVEIFRERAMTEWLSLLKEAGVPCTEVMERYNIGYFDDPHMLQNGMVAEYRHPVFGRMKFSTSGVKFRDTEALAGRPTPLLGEHTREALLEVGYTEQEVTVLYQKGIAKAEEPPSE
jgi:crotonobetainyl-CoA:carnitine CoA-transferase CaiB-like acyl-CoA transferase